MNIPASIALAKEGTISLHRARNIITACPVLLPSTVDTILDSYFLRYWSPTYFRAFLQDGIIAVDTIIPDTNRTERIRYQVHYVGCNANSILTRSQVALSFRKPKPTYPIGNHVIVTFGG